MSRSLRTLAAIHLAGNALLLWLGYYWLGIGESRAATLAWSTLVAIALLCLAGWVHGSTFTWFSDPKPGVAAAFRKTLRHLPAVLLVTLAALVLYYWLARWDDYSGTPAFRIASYLTLKFRKPVKPATVLRLFHAVLWIIEWVVVPVVLLPLVARVAQGGWSGFRQWPLPGRRAWLQTPVLLLCALWLPLRLLNWVPDVGSFGMEMASFVVRGAVAYLLLVSAWLLLVALTAGGSPLFSHPKTASRP